MDVPFHCAWTHPAPPLSKGGKIYAIAGVQGESAQHVVRWVGLREGEGGREETRGPYASLKDLISSYSFFDVSGCSDIDAIIAGLTLKMPR